MKNNKKIILPIILIIFLISLNLFLITNADYIYQKSEGPGYINEIVKNDSDVNDVPINLASGSDIYIHDGIAYTKGKEMGKFSLSGYCACTKCGTGTGLTASGKKVRENHTIAADWKVLPKGTVIILEDAVGKDGQIYDGVYVVEDRGGGVKNNHLDIYRPTHELASLVTHYGRAYGNVYIAEPFIVATNSNIQIINN